MAERKTNDIEKTNVKFCLMMKRINWIVVTYFVTNTTKKACNNELR